MSNVAVFTTKYVVEKGSPIIYVSHDDEGDWQFFSKEDATEQEARIVTLDEIIERDPSIKEILWMPEGMEAWREGAGKAWTTKVG
jgi:hypothetical protein